MDQQRIDLTPPASIKVVGVGGGGGNAINRMVRSKLEGIDFVAINTDSQVLQASQAHHKVIIGTKTTRGLGAGANSELGKKAAEEDRESLKRILEGSDMVFITLGLGGGTGTGAAPIVADVAKELGALVVAVVTKPFSFEGARRMRVADEGWKELKDKVDTIITIPNDKLLNLIDRKTSVIDAFEVVDDVLLQGVQGISDLITQRGLINVDFSDVKTVMKNAGSALMGIGYGTGENRAAEAARTAMESPLLDVSIAGAKGLLINITGGSDLSMMEIDEAAKIITEHVDADANIIIGNNVDDASVGEIKISVIATGFDLPDGGVRNTVPAASRKVTMPSAPGAANRPRTNYFGAPGAAAGETQRSTPPLGAPRPSSQMNPARPTASQEANAADEAELDVPAFIRRKMQ